VASPDKTPLRLKWSHLLTRAEHETDDRINDMLHRCVEKQERPGQEELEWLFDVACRAAQAEARVRELTEAHERLLSIIGEHCGFGSATYKRAESLAVLSSEEPKPYETDDGRCWSCGMPDSDEMCSTCGSRQPVNSEQPVDSTGNNPKTVAEKEAAPPEGEAR